MLRLLLSRKLRADVVASVLSGCVTWALAGASSVFAETPAVPVAAAAPATSVAVAGSAKPDYAILVDKKSNGLKVAQYVDGKFVVVKSFHATLGQVKGDKEEEGDLKTPEGIYTFKQLLTSPGLPKKFGSMAFYVDYPNTFDRLAGRSGKDIMLHSTDTPDRLKQNYDSLGCIVVQNDELREIKPYIRMGLTPIMIFSDMSDEYLRPDTNSGLSEFFSTWVKSWETKSIDDYMSHYHSDFSAQGKNKSAWKSFKTQLNQRYATIEIGPESVHYYRHPKYSMITFTQNYRSKLKGGGWGHRSRGTKILYVAEEAGKPKIIAESYTNLMW